MAKKKVEIALQEEIETQEEWETSLQKEGLLVIDIYQSWSGPCKAATGIFRRLKTELNDDYLNFAVAKADTIESLEKYRGKCEPCFLFFGGGKLVAVVRGVNPPEMEKNILSMLKQEHEVMKGECERVEIKDPVILAQELAEEEERRRLEEEEEVEQEFTIAVLKPDIVSSGRADELVEELMEKGIEIVERKEHMFTREEAEEFYANVKDEPYFVKLVDFMTSGPCEVLLCAKGAEGVIEELRGLIAPAVIEDEESPGLRAKYATDVMKNAIHASDSLDEAARELAFFYPDFQRPIVRVRRPKPASHIPEEGEPELSEMHETPETPGIQRTVALIRPYAYAKNKEAILERINEAGFVISTQKEIELTKEQAEEFYSEHRGEYYFEELTTVMSSGPLLALLLARKDAVKAWRKLIGPDNLEEAKYFHPDSLRVQFAAEEEGIKVNPLHGSSTDEEAARDMDFFFPMEQTVAVIKPDAYANRDEIIERIKSAGYHVAARRETQLTEEIAKELYADMRDKPFYEDLVRHMISGPTLCMVLTGQDVVAGWRKLMGPADPDKAADEKPTSNDPNDQNIRAIYGRNVLENAVHGSSTISHAQKTMQLLFGVTDITKRVEEPAESAEPTQEAVAEEADHVEQPEVAPETNEPEAKDTVISGAEPTKPEEPTAEADAKIEEEPAADTAVVEPTKDEAPAVQEQPPEEPSTNPEPPAETEAPNETSEPPEGAETKPSQPEDTQ